MGRSFGAVAAGFVVWTVLFLGSNLLIATASPDSFNPDGSTDNAGILVLILFLSFLFSIVSGWLTSRIDPIQAFRSTMALGILLLVVGIGVQSQYWDLMPLWYHLVFLGALIPGVLTGYKWAMKTVSAPSLQS